MSSKIINEKLIGELIEKIKLEYSLSDDKEVANLIGISAQNFSAKKKKGTVVNDILCWAIEKDKDLNFLFKSHGYDEKKASKKGNQYLEEAFGWINKLLTEDVRNQNWFEVQFEKAFPEFIEQKEEKEGKGALKTGDPIKKVA